MLGCVRLWGVSDNISLCSKNQLPENSPRAKMTENDYKAGDIDNNNNNPVLVARGGPERANPARTEATLRDGSLGDPQHTC